MTNSIRVFTFTHNSLHDIKLGCRTDTDEASLTFNHMTSIHGHVHFSLLHLHVLYYPSGTERCLWSVKGLNLALMVSNGSVGTAAVGTCVMV